MSSLSSNCGEDFDCLDNVNLEVTLIFELLSKDPVQVSMNK